MTPLHATLKRALTIDGRDYVLTLTQSTLKLTLKGKRNGVELPWTQLVNGEAALAVALHASLGAFAAKPANKAPAARAAASAPDSFIPSAAAAPRSASGKRNAKEPQRRNSARKIKSGRAAHP
jgi:hypothetical protein